MNEKILEAAFNGSKPSTKSHIFQTITEPKFMVVDWKGHYNSRGLNSSIELCCTLPVSDEDGQNVGGIAVNNSNRIDITFDLMGENALCKSKKLKYSQCETIAYPTNFNFSDEWVLLMEMKYVKSLDAIIHDSLSYPNKMVTQISDTTSFLRDNNIVSSDIDIYAAVAFPNHEISAYSDFLFMRLADEFENLKLDKNIYLRPSVNIQINSKTDLDLL